jgi:cystinosin
LAFVLSGLSTDFCYLNVFGFVCYAAFNASLFWSKTLQQEYTTINDGQTIKVQSNDVAFALHAVLLSSCWVVQIWWYNDTLAKRLPSRPTMLVIGGMIIISLAYIFMIFHHGDDTASYLNWLDFLYMLANFKVIITICKYTPQVFLNCKRRSTEGWNVWNVLLDFTGGTLSLLQLIGDCWNTNDWHGITGDPAKFALGFVSIFFDLIFFVQHYILYPSRAGSPYQEVSSAVPDSFSGREQQPSSSAEEMVGLNGRQVV